MPNNSLQDLQVYEAKKDHFNIFHLFKAQLLNGKPNLIECSKTHHSGLI